MDCTKARNLLSEYQDGTLDAADAAALDAHIRGCGECADAYASLLAVRELLRTLPPDPAPPELLARVLASVETEDRHVRQGSSSDGVKAARPILARFRVPLEAAAVVLLFSSVYWYQHTSTPTTLLPSGLSADLSSEIDNVTSSRPAAERKDVVKGSPPGIRSPGVKPKMPGEAAPSAAKPRTWTEADLPSVPAIRASTDSERIVPVAPPPPLSTLPYGRDIVVDVNPESRAGAEERIAETASRLGGIVERNERERESTREGAAGTVLVILPEAAAVVVLDELRRIGTVPPEGMTPAIDIPKGPRPGTVAYAVRVRVR